MAGAVFRFLLFFFLALSLIRSKPELMLRSLSLFTVGCRAPGLVGAASMAASAAVRVSACSAAMAAVQTTHIPLHLRSFRSAMGPGVLVVLPCVASSNGSTCCGAFCTFARSKCGFFFFFFFFFFFLFNLTWSFPSTDPFRFPRESEPAHATKRRRMRKLMSLIGTG